MRHRVVLESALDLQRYFRRVTNEEDRFPMAQKGEYLCIDGDHLFISGGDEVPDVVGVTVKDIVELSIKGVHWT